MILDSCDHLFEVDVLDLVHPDGDLAVRAPGLIVHLTHQYGHNSSGLYMYIYETAVEFSYKSQSPRTIQYLEI
jgi:hypothetical protein